MKVTPPGQQTAPSQLLDVTGLARRLGVTERFVRRLVLERRIPFLKIGHFVRFDPADVDRLLANSRVEELGLPDLCRNAVHVARRR
ncbi:MAG: helix-turn-helix domain-containing protein [Actinomycetota bacterium]